MSEENKILKKSDCIVLNQDFVAIGSTIDFGHVSIIAKHENKLYEFDFVVTTGIQVETYNSSNTHYKGYSDYYKITKTIQPELVAAFVAHCLQITKKAKPQFGYFYSGESYSAGNHRSNNNLGERMTCVGFCLNVLKGFLGKDYLQYLDWDSSTCDSEWVQRYCTENQLDIALISPFLRRINSQECLYSCFFTEMPIRKIQIENAIRDFSIK